MAELPPPVIPDPDDRVTPGRPRRGRLIALVLGVIVLAAVGWYYWHEHTLAAQDAATAPGASGGSADKSAKGGGAAGGGPAGGRRGADPRTVLPVAVAPAKTADFTVWLNALGNVNARSTVTVRPRVDGQLARVLFREGQIVKAGELLAEIDPKPFEVQVTQANGQLARDQAMLANARIDLARYQTLQKQDSIAQQQVDTQAALVRQLEGTIEADRGVVDNAKLQLSYTRITAPAGGRTGLRQVDAGNMVRQTDTNGLVVITQVQPINVVYSIPEDKLVAVNKRMQNGDAPVVDAYDRDGKIKLASGKLVTLDNQIDPTTGTIKLKAEFANENTALFPNQFVNVRMQLDTLHGVTTVPTSAVQRGSPGTFVYRLNDDNTVSVRVVKLGPAEGEMTVIDSGLQPGERVVTDGADKLRDGAKIEPVTPEQRAAPPSGAARRADGKGSGKGGGRRNGAAAGSVGGAAPDNPSAGAGRRAAPPPRRRPPVRRPRRLRHPHPAPAHRAADPSPCARCTRHESVPALHPAAGRDLAADGRHAARGHRRLSRAADLGAAGGRLPDDPGRDALSGREPRRDDLVGHRAARAPVRADAGPGADVVDQLRRRVGHHAAVQPRRCRSTSPSRRCRPRSTPRAASCRRDLPHPPIYSKVNPADAPILTLAVTSTTLPLPKVQDLVDTRLAQKISQLPGVGLVSIAGGQRPAVRIQANPTALASLRPRASTTCARRSRNANVNQAKGSFDGPTRASTIDANDQLRSADEYRQLIIAYRNGAPVRAHRRRRRRSTAPRTSRLGARGRTITPAVIVNIQRQPGANVIEVVDRIKALLPQLQASLPASVDADAAHRPHDDHPRVGARRAVRAAARHRRSS